MLLKQAFALLGGQPEACQLLGSLVGIAREDEPTVTDTVAATTILRLLNDPLACVRRCRGAEPTPAAERLHGVLQELGLVDTEQAEAGFLADFRRAAATARRSLEEARATYPEQP